MNCEVARNFMSLYIDKELNEIEKADFEKHIEQCNDCKHEYELLLEIISECNIMDEVELPQGFSQSLHERLINEKASLNKGGSKRLIKRINWKIATGIAAAAIVFAIGAGSGGLKGFANKATDGSQPQTAMSAPMEGFEVAANYTVGTGSNAKAMAKQNVNNTTVAFDQSIAAANADTANAVKQATLTSEDIREGRKIIKFGSVSIEVVNFDDKIRTITQMVQSMGGYIENSQIDNVSYNVEGLEENKKRGNIVVRVPADKFEQFFEEIKGQDNVINENISGNDITMEYRDTATRVENLKVQEKSLQTLMEKAKNVDEILKIETELNRVRTDIDLMTGDLKRWDNLVDYSTLNIQLIEVDKSAIRKGKSDSVWGRAYNGFVRAVNNIITNTGKLIIFMFSAIPYLLIIGFVIAIALYIKKKRS